MWLVMGKSRSDFARGLGKTRDRARAAGFGQIKIRFRPGKRQTRVRAQVASGKRI